MVEMRLATRVRPTTKIDADRAACDATFAKACCFWGPRSCGGDGGLQLLTPGEVYTRDKISKYEAFGLRQRGG